MRTAEMCVRYKGAKVNQELRFFERKQLTN